MVNQEGKRLGVTVKVVERAGVSLKRQLVKTDVSSEHGRAVGRRSFEEGWGWVVMEMAATSIPEESKTEKLISLSREDKNLLAFVIVRLILVMRKAV